MYWILLLVRITFIPNSQIKITNKIKLFNIYYIILFYFILIKINL